jgi:membrane-associated phospholipid phosphatase
LAAAAIAIDMLCAQFFHDVGLGGDVKRLIRLSEVFGWGGSVGLIVLTAAVLDERTWRVALRLAAGAWGAGLLADGVKLLIARTRPSAANLQAPVAETFVAWLPLAARDSLGHGYGHALQSIPSAHTATAAGLAVGLAALYPRGRWLFAAFAVLAGLQRLDAQAHFLSDVLLGGALGCLVGAALAWRLDAARPDR